MRVHEPARGEDGVRGDGVTLGVHGHGSEVAGHVLDVEGGLQGRGSACVRACMERFCVYVCVCVFVFAFVRQHW